MFNDTSHQKLYPLFHIMFCISHV